MIFKAKKCLCWYDSTKKKRGLWKHFKCKQAKNAECHWNQFMTYIWIWKNCCFSGNYFGLHEGHKFLYEWNIQKFWADGVKEINNNIFWKSWICGSNNRHMSLRLQCYLPNSEQLTAHSDSHCPAYIHHLWLNYVLTIVVNLVIKTESFSTLETVQSHM